jgi:MFS transporter, CP family, cyanate transporter
MNTETNQIPRSVLPITMLLAFAMWSPLTIVPIMEPILVKALSITHAQASLLYSGPILILAILGIPAGIVADKIGIKRAAGIGVTIIALGTALRGTANSYTILLAFTLVYGLGLSLSLPNLPKLVGLCFPRSKANITMGVISVAIIISSGLSLAITMPLVFRVTNSFQGVFFIWSIPPLLASIVWWLFVKDPPCEIRNIGKVIADTQAILRNKSLWLVGILFFFHNVYFYTWAGWVPDFLLNKGASSNIAGFIVSVTLWVGVPSVIIATRLSSRFGLRKPFLWIPSIMLAFTAWAIIVSNLPMSWVIMGLMGAATTTRYTTIQTLPVEMVPQSQIGIASGLVTSVGYVGAVIGPLVGGHILDVTGDFPIIFLILIGVSTATTVIAFSLKETGRDLREK